MINLIKIKGTEPASSVRLVLNSNLEILQASINKIDSILNLSSGNFDNSLINQNIVGEIKTGKITTTGTIGVVLINGNVNLKTGKIILESTTAEIDFNQGVKLIKKSYDTSTTPLYALNMYSMLKFKGFTSLELLDIVNPEEGLVAFNSSTKKLVLYDGTGWSNLN
jgi:hypothetical protein